jgi:hypothetical protein
LYLAKKFLDNHPAVKEAAKQTAKRKIIALILGSMKR